MQWIFERLAWRYAWRALGAVGTVLALLVLLYNPWGLRDRAVERRAEWVERRLDRVVERLLPTPTPTLTPTSGVTSG